MKVLYFGTYERDYPRNAQVISCLRGAGVDVVERHASVWEGQRQSWQAGLGTAARLAAAEVRLLRRPTAEFDVLLVGYPGHLDLAAARRAADLTVADTQANAAYLADLAGLPPDRIDHCLVGAEERLFRPGWSPQEPFTFLFVGKLIPLHGLETILAAALEAPELRIRLIGSGQLEPLLE